MSEIFSLTVPLLLLCIAAYGIVRRVDVFSSLVSGAGDGLGVVVKIVPTLIALLTAIAMLRASGALDIATNLLRPLFSLVGIPPECAPLVLLRPFSGSGALAMGADLIRQYGVDSLVGRTTAVMLGSTETTFYAIGIYFGSVGVTRSRYVLPAALMADAVGFVAASWAARLL